MPCDETQDTYNNSFEMSEFSDIDLMVHKNISIMNQLSGFGVVMVCCSSFKQAQYWQKRLDNGKGSLLAENTYVVAVEEDWPGGAGNALGTLYAFTKASKIASEKYNIDILSMVKAGNISVGLYHTAGKGTRLAPLPGAENNNKPGVKLPATIVVGGKTVSMTILEAVIKQTGCYAKSRMGRLSVFWGDQIFIPTIPVEYKASHHVDILCSLGPMLSEKEWKEKGMEKYGLIARSRNGSAAQVEKVDHSTAVKLLSSIGEIESVGASLGSFSVSSFMLDALLVEFSSELEKKKGKLDSDPHLWMPMTLEKPAYLQLMKQKGIDEDISSAHFDRIAVMMKKFNEVNSSASYGLFGPVDVGQGVYWWDYGLLKLYQRNTLLVSEKTKEASLMRLFMGISESELVRQSVITNTSVDQNSCIAGSVIGNESGNGGFIRNSVLNNVRCKYIEADNCILMNVTAERIIAKGGNIVYNLIDDGVTAGSSLSLLEEKKVVVGVFNESGTQTVMTSDMETDGGKAWEKTLEVNNYSFEQIYNLNVETCPITLEDVIANSHKAVWSKL